ncbi:MAG: DNA N-6-adenine-methyltransferase [Candidatus Peregrinibacteria bacterium]
MTKNLSVHFSSASDDWATPQDFFDELDKEFHFGLDVCATQENFKCDFFYNPFQDGLKADWQEDIECLQYDQKDYSLSIWCNPPYGREIGKWVKKASDEAAKGLATIVMLLPARTDTKYFHEYLYQKPNVELRFIKGRLKFGGAKNSAPFPSLVAIFKTSL